MTAPSIRVIVADNASLMTLDGTHTYIIGELEALIVDPGPDLEEHVAAVSLSVAGARRVEIVATHRHRDHLGGAAKIAAQTGARIRLSRAARENMPESAPVLPLTDGAILNTDAGPVTVVATPGHTPDHIALLWEFDEAPRGRAVFVGDLMLGEGDTTLVAAPEGNVRDYLESLDRVEGIEADVLYPAHGPPMEDPRVAIGRYRGHRMERVNQVRQVLTEHPSSTTAELVDRIYGTSIDPRLRAGALGSVAAVVEYLREGG